VQASVSPIALTLDRLHTPIGDLLIVGDNDGRLRAAEFHDFEDRLHRSLQLKRATPCAYSLREGRASKVIRERLQAYFAGELAAIDDIAIATGGTEFQQKVWRALRKIAPGRTMTYGALARRLGATNAMRAVGAANGANPLSFVVPCHRAIGKSGDLTGYHWGLTRKRAILGWEAGQVSS